MHKVILHTKKKHKIKFILNCSHDREVSIIKLKYTLYTLLELLKIACGITYSFLSIELDLAEEINFPQHGKQRSKLRREKCSYFFLVEQCSYLISIVISSHMIVFR